jgi:nicotinamidase-related amidase
MGQKVLVIIDMQKDFIDGALGCGQAALDIIPVIENMIKQGNYDKLVFTQDIHDSEAYHSTREGKLFPLHCVANTSGSCVDETLMQAAIDHGYSGDPVMRKNTFGSLELLSEVHEDDIDEIVFCGLTTNICVLHNVIFAVNLLADSIKIVVMENACASYDKELHDQAIVHMKLIGAEIRTSVV